MLAQVCGRPLIQAGPQLDGLYCRRSRIQAGVPQELPDGFQRPKPGRPVHPDGKLSAAVTGRRPGDQETPFFAPKPETLLATFAPRQYMAGALHIVGGSLERATKMSG